MQQGKFSGSVVKVTASEQTGKNKRVVHKRCKYTKPDATLIVEVKEKEKEKSTNYLIKDKSHLLPWLISSFATKTLKITCTWEGI